MIPQHERLREIAALLTRQAPIGWQRLALVFRCTVSVSTATYLITNALGAEERSPAPSAVLRKMHELRTSMADEERGSWFTALLLVEPPGRYETYFDYDEEPDFVPPLLPAAWALDFARFPRSPEYTPEWLRKKLEQ